MGDSGGVARGVRWTSNCWAPQRNASSLGVESTFCGVCGGSVHDTRVLNEMHMRVDKGVGCPGYPQTPQDTDLRHPFDGCAVSVTEVVTA